MKHMFSSAVWILIAMTIKIRSQLRVYDYFFSRQVHPRTSASLNAKAPFRQILSAEV